MLCSWAWRKQVLGCRPKCLCYTLALVLVLLLVALQKDPSITSVLDLELPKCPACYGISLCTDMVNGQFHFVGWNSWRVLRFLNQKNVYHARIRQYPVVLKKLAHDWEIQQLDAWLCKQAFDVDECDVGAAAVALSSPNGTRKAAVIPFGANDFAHCTDRRLVEKISDVFSRNEPLSNKHANVLTLMHLNPEPLIIQAFPYEEGWPFPRHLGACGRVVVEADVGPSLASYGNAPWKTRVRLAHKLTQVAGKLTVNKTPYCLYMTDVTLSNYAISPKEEVILVDVENVIVAMCRPDGGGSPKVASLHANHMAGNDVEMVYSADELCSAQVSDHNYYAICQGILSTRPWSDEIVGGLLHSLPQEVDARWNITSLVNECSKPTTYFGRFAAFAQLRKMLKVVSATDDL